MKDLYVMDSKTSGGGKVVIELLAIHTLTNHNAPQDVEFLVTLNRQGTKVKEWGYWSLTSAREIYEVLSLALSCFEA